MVDYNLEQYVEKFNQLKTKLIKDHGVDPHDAALLASRLLELPQGSPSSLYFEIKQGHKFKPYRFLGIGLTIRKIDISTSSPEKTLKLSFSVKRGINQHVINLTKTKALLFLTLLALKYKNFESDAIGGFDEYIDSYAFDLSKSIGTKSDAFESTHFDGLKRTLNDYGYGDLIERENGLSRLSVPPHHITFEEGARKFFEEMTGNQLAQFEKAFGPRIFTV